MKHENSRDSGPINATKFAHQRCDANDTDRYRIASHSASTKACARRSAGPWRSAKPDGSGPRRPATERREDGCGFARPSAVPAALEDQFQSSEVLIAAAKKGLRIGEVPIRITRREFGESRKGTNFAYGALYLRTVAKSWWR